jgi:hypothetical protein
MVAGCRNGIGLVWSCISSTAKFAAAQVLIAIFSATAIFAPVEAKKRKTIAWSDVVERYSAEEIARRIGVSVRTARYWRSGSPPRGWQQKLVTAELLRQEG